MIRPPVIRLPKKARGKIRRPSRRQIRAVNFLFIGPRV